MHVERPECVLMNRPLSDIAELKYVSCEPPEATPRAWLHSLMFDWGIIVHGERNTQGWPPGTTTAPARSVVVSWECDTPTVRIADVPIALYAEHNVVLRPRGVDRFYLAGVLMAHHSALLVEHDDETHPARHLLTLRIPHHDPDAQRTIGQRARVLAARARSLEEATASYLRSLEQLSRDVMNDAA